MPYLEVYIGDLDEADRLLGKGCPRRASPFFPRVGDSDPFGRVIGLIEDGVFRGRQQDWGAWVAEAYPAQVLQLIDLLYRERDAAELRTFVVGLDPTKLYALVASEF